MNCLGKVVRCRRRQPRRRNSVTVIGQISVYRPDWMRKPNCVVNDCCETDADEEQNDDRSRARLQRPLVSMMRVYAALGPTSNVVVETRPHSLTSMSVKELSHQPAA